MDQLIIEKANNTPYVSLDAKRGVLEFTGRSIPENPGAYYDPIYAWLKQYFEDPQSQTEINFTFEYINSGSSKCILEILRIIIENTKNNNIQLIINWYYEEEDESILELGEHYKSVSDLPFNLIPVLV